MKKFIEFILLISAAITVLGSCDRYLDGYYDDRYYETNTDFLTLRNYSSDSTVWFIPEAGCKGDLPSELSEWQLISVYRVPPKSAVQLSFDSNDNYETPVETYGINDMMTIYVFKEKVWDKYGWGDIVAGQMWCGKCRLSVEEAVALHGIVTYPMR